MATLITKNSSTASSIPTAAQLVQGELAVNVADKRIFTENSAGAVVELGTNPSSITTGSATITGAATVGAGLAVAGAISATGGGAGNFAVQALSELRSNSDAIGNAVEMLFTPIISGQTRTAIGGVREGATANAAVYFATNNTERMRLDSAGNLGIGTSSPTQKLHVKSTSGGYTAQFEGAGASDSRINVTNTGVSNTSIGFNNSGSTNSFGIPTGVSYFTNENGYPIAFSTGSTERARIDSAGNLGLGVVPSAWKSNYKAIQLGTLALASGGSGFEFMYSNAYINSSDVAVYSQSSTTATAYRMNSGNGTQSWYAAPSGTAGAAINFTQAMTLSPSGGLNLVGTANIAAGLYSGAGFQANGVVFSSASGIYNGVYAPSDSVIAVATAGAERARIDSSGNLLVGTTSVSGRGGLTISPNLGGAGSYCRMYFNGNNADDLVYFMYQDAVVGRINISTTATAYVTSSDYRLKESVVPMTDALSKVALLKPVTYKWKSDGSEGQGFIAHELQEVVPNCVVGEKDETETRTVETSPAIPAVVDADGVETSPAVAAVTKEQVFPKYQGIDTSFLVATLVAAIQEQQVLIKDLTARLEALEAA
jgi:hypothetical protein